MSKTTLVVLAAGFGSRYGGIKQLETVSAEGETIIDFSLFDALNSGFSKVVFVIRNQIMDSFKIMFDDKLRGNFEVEYVSQEVDAIPEKFSNLERTKPWGTGHALLVAKECVSENFCVINADDFYGKSAFETIYANLQKTDSSKNDFLMVGYLLKNTLSKNGSVSRGQCLVNKLGFLEEIVERTKIFNENGKISYLSEDQSNVEIDPNTIVSMNCWGFTPKIFNELENKFEEFLQNYSKKSEAEFFANKVVNDLIKDKKARVKVLKSESNWMGITYKQDRQQIVEKIKRLKENGEYPQKLW